MSLVSREYGGIVLAGGRSRRMGTDKAALTVDGVALLERVVAALCSAVTGPIVIASAAGRGLPVLPDDLARRVVRVDDPVPDAGPLIGLASGLRAVLAQPARPESVAVLSVDLPWVAAEHVRRLLDLLEGDSSIDAVVPLLDGRPQPLAAAWRTHVLPTADRLIDAGERGLRPLLAAVRVRRASAADVIEGSPLARLDPALSGLRDVDRPGDLTTPPPTAHRDET